MATASQITVPAESDPASDPAASRTASMSKAAASAMATTAVAAPTATSVSASRKFLVRRSAATTTTTAPTVQATNSHVPAVPSQPGSSLRNLYALSALAVNPSVTT